MKTDSTTSLRGDYTRANYTLKCSECLEEVEASDVEIVGNRYVCNSCRNKEIEGDSV